MNENTVGEICHTCRFWSCSRSIHFDVYHEGNDDDEFSVLGVCRRHSPVKGFPVSRSNDWCGEYEWFDVGTQVLVNERVADLIDQHIRNSECTRCESKKVAVDG